MKILITNIFARCHGKMPEHTHYKAICYLATIWWMTNFSRTNMRFSILLLLCSKSTTERKRRKKHSTTVRMLWKYFVSVLLRSVPFCSVRFQFLRKYSVNFVVYTWNYIAAKMTEWDRLSSVCVRIDWRADVSAHSSIFIHIMCMKKSTLSALL